MEDELEQYEKRFDSKPERAGEKSVPLDLSEVCTEFLGTNEATAGEKPVDLAVLLSAVMKHPDLPKKIYDLSGDELNHIPEDLTENPETIRYSLEYLTAEEGEK